MNIFLVRYTCACLDTCRGRTWQTKYSVLAHWQADHDVELGAECNFCHKKFICSAFLKKHIKESHVKDNPVQEYPCTICGKVFNKTTSLKEHELRHSAVKNITCDYCDYKVSFQPFHHRPSFFT